MWHPGSLRKKPELRPDLCDCGAISNRVSRGYFAAGRCENSRRRMQRWQERAATGCRMLFQAAPVIAHRATGCCDAGHCCRLRAMSEVSLYPAVKRFLEAAGFEVKGEVKGCDAVAVRNDGQQTLAIVEMKLGLNLELLLQATDRMRAADEVWLAVPATRRGRDRDARVHRLCRLIGFGLLAVNVARDGVEVLVEPGPYRPRLDHRKRERLLSEHARRRGDPSPGGSTRQPVMTAYRQQALACAALLKAGPGRPRELRAMAPDAASILLRNVYGWFERTGRGVYQLTAIGEAALKRWPETPHQAPIGEVEPVAA
jgi:hypothetical protein